MGWWVFSLFKNEVPTSLMIINPKGGEVIRVPKLAFDGDLLNLSIETVTVLNAIQDLKAAPNFSPIGDRPLLRGFSSEGSFELSEKSFDTAPRNRVAVWRVAVTQVVAPPDAALWPMTMVAELLKVGEALGGVEALCWTKRRILLAVRHAETSSMSRNRSPSLKSHGFGPPLSEAVRSLAWWVCHPL